MSHLFWGTRVRQHAWSTTRSINAFTQRGLGDTTKKTTRVVNDGEHACKLRIGRSQKLKSRRQIKNNTFGFDDATRRGSRIHVTRQADSPPFSPRRVRSVRCLQNAAATFGVHLLRASMSVAAARTSSLETRSDRAEPSARTARTTSLSSSRRRCTRLLARYLQEETRLCQSFTKLRHGMMFTAVLKAGHAAIHHCVSVSVCVCVCVCVCVIGKYVKADAKKNRRRERQKRTRDLLV